jgi:excisionase family DNA binding protein
MKLYTTHEIAEVLDRTERSVRHLIAEGRLHAVKVGAHTRIMPEEFDRFLRELPAARLADRKRGGKMPAPQVNQDAAIAA